MSVKWRARGRYEVASGEVEDHSEVEVDDSRPLDVCTVDEAVEKIGFGVFQVIVTIFAGLKSTVISVEVMLLAVLSAVLKCEWGLSEFQEASLTSVVFVGFFFGSIFWGFFADFYGRKWGLFFVALLSSCFGIMSAFAPNFEMLLFLRTMMGFTAGGSAQGTTFCAEYLPSKSRGVGIMLTELFWVAGAIGIVAIGWATVPTLGWRWLLGFAAIPVTVMTFFIPLMPSSPRYLIIKGKREQALRNINIVARINCKSKLHIKLVTDEEKAEMMSERLTDRPSINDENGDSLSKSSSQQTMESLDKDQDNGEVPGTIEDNVSVALRSPSKNQKSHPLIAKKSRIQMLQVLELFRNGMWKTTFLLWAIWLNFVAYYYGIILLTTVLFQYDKHCSLSSCTAGVDICKTLDSDDYIALLWTSVAEVPGILFTTFLMVMPCLGRKMVMASGMAILTIFTGLLLICADRIVLTIILFVCRGIMGGIFQAIFVYTPEVYSTTVRGLGLGISSTFGRIGGVLVPYVALPLIRASDIAGILVFVGIAASSVVLIAILPIETKGRALKDTNK